MRCQVADLVSVSAALPPQVPMTFIYGDRDWMDPRGGQRALAGARQRRQPTTPGDLRLFTVANSGHYTFVDQPEEFLQLMTTTCQPYIEVRTLHLAEGRLQLRVLFSTVELNMPTNLNLSQCPWLSSAC